MLRDLDTSPRAVAEAASVVYDVCVIGAGFAGITVANRLARAGRRVLLLEAGGRELTEASQELYVGESVGRSYFPLQAARLRVLGGSSNHWTGRCRTLDAHDFESHGAHEYADWPITKESIAGYAREVEDLLGLERLPPDRALSYVADDSPAGLRQVFFEFSDPPTLMARKLARSGKARDALTTFLNASVIAIELAADSDRVTSVTARGYSDSTLKVRAGSFVLACGGLENPRMLLLMQRMNEAHDGIRNDNVGRFFMEHLEVRVGRYVTSDAQPDFAREREYYAPTPDFLRERRILNCCVRVYPFGLPYAEGSWQERLVDLSCRADWISAVSERFARTCRRHGHSGGGLYCATEQAPNPNSRVTLAETGDRFGLPRLRLDWRLSDVEKRTMRESILEFGRYVAANDIGRVRAADWLLEEDDFIPGLEEGQRVAGYHHMGTTRMAADARRGVVDSDCRYFGIDNLYLAGSSIFSTCGYANPTYTLLQFAMRLGDHLIDVTARDSVQVS